MAVEKAEMPILIMAFRQQVEAGAAVFIKVVEVGVEALAVVEVGVEKQDLMKMHI